MRPVFFSLFIFGVHGVIDLPAPAQRTNLQNFKTGVNWFAMQLHKTATKDQKGNFISCPFSTYMVLAMASFGSKNATLKEFHKVLYLSGDTFLDYLNSSHNFQDLREELKTLGPTLNVGSQMFVSSHIPVMNYYRAFINQTFSSSVMKVNFNDSEKAAEEINSWSKKMTRGQIEKIVESDELTADAQILLLNSGYFNGTWQQPFPKERTEALPFHANGQTDTVNVTTMIQAGFYKFRYIEEMNAHFVILPYQSEHPQVETYLYLFVPVELDGLEDIEAHLDYLTIARLHTVEIRMLTLTVPKFKIENTLQMGKYLDQMGLKSALKAEANFFAMTRREKGPAISRVIQRAVIDFNEEGTAATAMPSSSSSLRYLPSPDDTLGWNLRIDRPFVFILGTENLILFTGKVVCPDPMNTDLS